ncbi:MAG: anaerobic nitric oxide reductase flavorubredoxin [Peptococcaceae bacterium]|nr:anaerobic nitric oxide reductase flavorubredoxin [Peptococcaceae bacterium]
MSIKLKDGITWVGKIDWELRKFHGESLSTHRGSSYNAFLVEDEKTVLVDTVWGPYAKEFIEDLKKTVDLKKIDYIIAQHGETDHSGSLSELLRYIPGTPVYCTANAVKSLKGQYHEDWNFQVVKTGDRLNIGSKEFVFIEAPMLHWPDSLLSYLTGDEILFSNDAFGQHYATAQMFNDLADQSEMLAEAKKYYANILAPFNKLVEKKIQEVLALNLPLKMICPDHGVIWRQNPAQIIEQYLLWARDYQENQITVLYDTMWNGTRRMAETIAEGIKEADPAVTVKLYHVGKEDINDIVTEVFSSKGIVVGSPTVNNRVLFSLAGLIDELGRMNLKNKRAAAFGAYGWSGEAVKLLNGMLTEVGFAIVNDGLRVAWNPDEEQLDSCRQFGRDFAADFTK